MNKKNDTIIPENLKIILIDHRENGNTSDNSFVETFTKKNKIELKNNYENFKKDFSDEYCMIYMKQIDEFDIKIININTKTKEETQLACFERKTYTDLFHSIINDDRWCTQKYGMLKNQLDYGKFLPGFIFEEFNEQSTEINPRAAFQKVLRDKSQKSAKFGSNFNYMTQPGFFDGIINSLKLNGFDITYTSSKSDTWNFVLNLKEYLIKKNIIKIDDVVQNTFLSCFKKTKKNLNLIKSINDEKTKKNVSCLVHNEIPINKALRIINHFDSIGNLVKIYKNLPTKKQKEEFLWLELTKNKAKTKRNEVIGKKMSENVYNLMIVLGFLNEDSDNNNNNNNKKNKNKNKDNKNENNNNIFRIFDAKSILKKGNVTLPTKKRSPKNKEQSGGKRSLKNTEQSGRKRSIKNKEQSGRKRSIKNKEQSGRKRRKTKKKSISIPHHAIVIDINDVSDDDFDCNNNN